MITTCPKSRHLFQTPRVCLTSNSWGQKRYSQEFILPSFWRSSGELLEWILTKPFILCVEGPNCSETIWEVFGWFFAIGRLFWSPQQGGKPWKIQRSTVYLQFWWLIFRKKFVQEVSMFGCSAFVCGWGAKCTKSRASPFASDLLLQMRCLARKFRSGNQYCPIIGH